MRGSRSTAALKPERAGVLAVMQEQSMIDRLQGIGPQTTNVYDARLTWYTDYNGKKVPTAVHRIGRGAPSG